MAIYCRISRDRTGGGLGVDRQREDCVQLAERLGWQVVTVHTDNDLSAYSGKPRPGYRALLADLRNGAADAVIAWHPDRLHRRPIELEEFIDVCEKHHVEIQTVRAGQVDLNTPTGRATARTHGAWSRHEVEHLIGRIRSAKNQAGRAGKYRGGRRPFGFKADGVTPIPNEAAELAAASERVLRGETIASIARDWNTRGVMTATGARWLPVTVRDVLVRPRNAAIIELDGEEIAAEWPAVVATEVWRAVREVLSDPSRRRPRSNELRWLGSGLYLCGVCGDGTTMRNAVISNSTSQGRRACYRCKEGGHLTRVAEPVDTYVTELVIARLEQPDAAQLLTPAGDEDAGELRWEAEKLVRTLDRIGDAYGDGTLDARQYNRQKARFELELARVRERLDATVERSPLGGIAGAGDVRGAWEALGVSRRKAVVGELMTVTLVKAPRGRRPGGGYFDPDCVRIDWRRG